MIGELAALGAAISWTVSAVLYKSALLKTKPVSANIVRLSCTSIILILCLLAIGKLGILNNLPSNAVFLACISGIIGLGIGDTLYMASLKFIGVARAVPITCTYPLFSLILSAFLLGQSITFSVILGAVIIVLGVWLLSKEKEKATFESKVLIKGVFCALATAIAWSISIMMIDVAVTLPETGDLDHALAINALRTMVVAVSLLALSPIIDRDHVFLKMEKKTFASLVLGGIVALGLGWFLLAYSFINTSAARAVPISSTTPLFSTLSAIIFLHEHVTVKNAAGSVMVVVGIFLIFLLPSV